MESSVPILAPAINGNRNNLLNRIHRAMETNQIVPKFYRGHVTALLIVLGIVAVSATAAIRLTSEDAGLLAQVPDQSVINPPDTGVTTLIVKKPEDPKAKTKTVEVTVIKDGQPDVPETPGTMIIKMTTTGGDSVIIVEADTIILEDEEEINESYQEALKDYQQAREEYQQKYEEVMKLKQEQFQQQLDEIQKSYQFEIQTEITDDSSGNQTRVYKIDKNVVVVPDEDLYYRYFSPGNFEYTLPEMESLNEDILKDYEQSMKEFEWQERDIDSYYDIQVDPLPEFTPLPPAEPNLFYYYENSKQPNLERLMRQELYKDDLIEQGHDYIIELDNRNLIINGEVQSKEMLKKYKRLYESVEETPLGPDMKYRLVI
jgi:tetratricopeptide (TPR) repeat protein